MAKIKEGDIYTSFVHGSIAGGTVKIPKANREVGCFESCWKSFDDKIMKPVFGKKDKSLQMSEAYESVRLTLLESVADPKKRSVIGEAKNESIENVNQSQADKK